MNPNWDLSYLYQGFDDPAFHADLARYSKEIAALRDILQSDLAPLDKLEQLVDA